MYADRGCPIDPVNPTTPADLAATIYHLLGVSPNTEIRDRLNRPLTLCDGRVIDGIVA